VPVEQLPVLVVMAQMLEVKMVAVVVTVAVVRSGMSGAAMSAAGGRISHNRERRGREGNRSDGGGQKCAGGSHWRILGSDRAERQNPPGRIRPGGFFIAICLVRVRDVADVDVASHDRAPHPAGRVATHVEAEVAVVPVVVVTVVVVVVMAVVVVMMAVMAVMAMTAMTAVAAGRRVARAGEGRNRQHNGSSSGSEDRTLHWNFSWG